MMISGSTLDTNSCPLNVVELECQFPNLLPIQTFSPSSPDVFISTRGCRLTININMCYNINKLLSFFYQYGCFSDEDRLLCDQVLRTFVTGTFCKSSDLHKVSYVLDVTEFI